MLEEERVEYKRPFLHITLLVMLKVRSYKITKNKVVHIFHIQKDQNKKKMAELFSQGPKVWDDTGSSTSIPGAAFVELCFPARGRYLPVDTLKGIVIFARGRAKIITLFQLSAGEENISCSVMKVIIMIIIIKVIILLIK